MTVILEDGQVGPRDAFEAQEDFVTDVPANIDAALRRHNARHGRRMQLADGGAQGTAVQAAHEPLRPLSQQ